MILLGHARRFSRSAAAALLLAGCLAAAAQAQSLEIIELQYRTADEVIPVLRPLLEPGAALSGKDDQLFVRTSRANLAQLRAALAQIDREPRQLFVSVRRGTHEEIEREGAAAAATVRSDSGSIAVNERPRTNAGITVQTTGSNVHRTDGSVAGVQVIEGSSAFIQTGSSVPVVTVIAGRGRGRSWIAGSTDYRELGSGFVVTPRVAADRVILDIAQHDDRLSGGSIRTQALTTQVSGRLGEWIELGGVSEAAATQRRGLLSRQYATRSDATSIWVRVEAR